MPTLVPAQVLQERGEAEIAQGAPRGPGVHKRQRGSLRQVDLQEGGTRAASTEVTP